METVDLLVCDGCQRRFTSIDGPAMLAALKGPCPSCGGHFQLQATPTPEQAPHREVPAYRRRDEAVSEPPLRR